MKIIQLTPGLSYGDAVSNDALAIKRILQEEHYETVLYSLNMDHRFPEGTAYPSDEMPVPDPEDLLLYHGAIGTELNEKLASYPCRKVMIYHNITPPDFFKPYSRLATRLSEAGYAEMKALSAVFDRCIADSDYNRQQLKIMGYDCEIDVCPIVIPFSDYDQEPDADYLRQYKDDKIKNWLFVGRIAPNKAQEDIIRAFRVYLKEYNPDARLFLVGSVSQDLKNYEDRLKEYARELGIADRVVFTGHISFRAILACYRMADAFVCMSEHEGFCVPVLEASHFGVPIVAYRSSAVPDTMGRGGLLLDSKDPYLTAAAVNRVLTDEALRTEIRNAQQERLANLSYEAVKKQFLDCLSRILK